MRLNQSAEWKESNTRQETELQKYRIDQTQGHGLLQSNSEDVFLKREFKDNRRITEQIITQCHCVIQNEANSQSQTRKILCISQALPVRMPYPATWPTYHCP